MISGNTPIFETEANATQAGRALEQGVAALVAMQHPGGSFPVLQRVGDAPWRHCHPLFSTLTVLLAAAPLMPVEAVSRAADFVARCRRPDGTWEFDPDFGIPPDADDTACGLIVLARHAPKQVSASDAGVLRSFWRLDGGPFQTWRGGKQWSGRDRDDAVVNCNVLLALSALGFPPSTEEVSAVVRLVQQSEGGCRYYCSPTTIAYAARRAGLPAEALPAGLVARPGSSGGVLPIAQWLSTIRRWDEDAIRALLAAQGGDGSWSIEPWFTGVAKPIPVWGSSAISTALCIEALKHAITGGAN